MFLVNDVVLKSYADRDDIVDTLVSSIKPILQKSFNEFAPYFVTPSNTTLNDKYTSVIDGHHFKLQYPVIGFDIKANMELINDSLNAPEFDQQKHVSVVVKGQGGGKTRILEELKISLNNDMSNTLAVAITYNTEWRLTKWEFNSNAIISLYPDKVNDEDHIVAVGVVYSVITRLTSMLYGCPFERAQGVLEQVIPHLPPLKLALTHFPLLLVAFIKAVVEDKRQRGRPVDRFVLLIDETTKADEILLLKDIENADPFAIIRHVFLGSDLQRYAGVEAALVMSSLTTTNLLHGTDSGHEYVPLLMPDTLDNTEIVWKWWLPQLDPLVRESIMASPRSLAVLRVFAAVCAQSPRAAEICGRYLASRLNAGIPLDAALLKEAVSTLPGRVNYQYALAFVPDHSHMHAYLFNEAIPVDSYVSAIIRRGIFTNTINTFRDTPSILPDSSVIIMTTAIMKTLQAIEKAPYMQLIVDIFNNCCNLLTSKGAVRADLLQRLVYNIFTAKLLCDMTSPDQPTTFTKLLCLPFGDTTSSLLSFRAKYRLDTPLPKHFLAGIKVVQLPNAHSDKQRYFDALADPDNVPSDICPYVIFLPPHTKRAGAPYDMMIATYTGRGNRPLIVFFGIDSSASVQRKKGALVKSQSGIFETMPEFGERYRATYQQIMLEHLYYTASGGLLSHIHCRQWIYVYMSTSTRYVHSYAVDNCLLLGPAEIGKFLGSFREVYEAAIAAFGVSKKATGRVAKKLSKEA